ncbi:hypothetical protein HGRIS_014118 [Hohenbuehelia grisea]|uniref:Isomerase YbhE n=1 Tax=Hohenbuehelia grisea TaxID=104357 RepID=A0ABR3JUH5_9AGAR
MVNFTILAGGFSTFVVSYLLDTDAKTLTLLKNSTTGQSPSWIASHPQNTSILYAVNEITPVGALQSFTVDSEGALTLVDTVSSGGNGPTFTNPLSTGEVSAMNFGSPNCSLVATVPGDPLHFQKDSPIVDFPVAAGAPSNPHMSLEFNGEVFVPDLGADKIWRLANTGTPGSFKVQGQIDIDAGAGPRHIAIQGQESHDLLFLSLPDPNLADNILFTLHEKTSALTAQQIPQGPNGTTFPLLANVSIVPPDQPEGSQFAAAELIISPVTEKFPTPLIYASNRNIGNVTDPRGDSIAIFEFKNGTEVDDASSTSATTGTADPECPSASGLTKRMRRLHRRVAAAKRAGPTLELVAQVFTGVDQIRGMALGRADDGGDEFIIVGANVGEKGVAVFRRVDGGRNLEEVARNTDVATRSSFVFL